MSRFHWLGWSPRAPNFWGFWSKRGCGGRIYGPRSTRRYVEKAVGGVVWRRPRHEYVAASCAATPRGAITVSVSALRASVWLWHSGAIAPAPSARKGHHARWYWYTPLRGVKPASPAKWGFTPAVRAPSARLSHFVRKTTGVKAHLPPSAANAALRAARRCLRHLPAAAPFCRFAAKDFWPKS